MESVLGNDNEQLIPLDPNLALTIYSQSSHLFTPVINEEILIYMRDFELDTH